VAKKFGVPVCPHAGGVGLCEYVQHLAMIDYVCVSGRSSTGCWNMSITCMSISIDPVVIKQGRYMPPRRPGYSIEMKPRSLDAHEFSKGAVWQRVT
jgi:L-fuconate dehydratase